MATKKSTKGLEKLLFLIGFLAVFINPADDNENWVLLFFLTKLIAASAFLGMYLINRNLSAQNPS